MRVFKLFFALVFLCVVPVVLAQEDCPSIVSGALQAVDSACNQTGRNQLCYGNIVLKATPRAGVADYQFEHAGDVVGVADIESLKLSSFSLTDKEWGVALMELQANLPNTLPGQNVTILLFGDVGMSEAGDKVVEVPVTATSQVNVRVRPTTTAGVLQALKKGQEVIAIGRLPDSTWVNIRLDDDSTGWVSADFVEGDLPSLLTTEPGTPAFGPMQAFYFTTGQGDAPCEGAPDSGILIQTPKGAGIIKLRANNVDIQLGSTVYLQAIPGDAMYVSVVEGHAVLTANGVTQVVPAGTVASVPLDASGVASGPPEYPQTYDRAAIQVLPLSVLPAEIAAQPVILESQIPAAIDMVNGLPPNTGNWEHTWNTVHIPDEPCFPDDHFTLGVERDSTTITFNDDRSAITLNNVLHEISAPGGLVPLTLYRSGAETYSTSAFSGSWQLTFTSPTTYVGTRVGWPSNPPCSWDQNFSGTYLS